MSQSIETQSKSYFAPTTQYDVAIVGAGPYGLATAAHLSAQGLNVIVFGKPMQLWREHMPEGMLLRSYWWATNISDPHKHYGLEQFCEVTGQRPLDPMARETVIDYGLWFYQQAIRNADQTYVRTIEQQESHFTLTLEDERAITCKAVVMAPGLGYYIHRPTEYSHLPSAVLSHTADHSSFADFAGKSLVIIGGGQSALETAALAHESGAHVQLISRSPLVWIQGSASFPAQRSFLERLRSPKAGIAPGWFAWQLEHFPYLFQSLPRAPQNRILRGAGSYGPMGASWLKPRVIGQVDLHELQRVEQIRDRDNGVEVTLSNNKMLHADHVILGTGYRADIKRLPMLHPSLLPHIKTYRNAPILSRTFESTVPGLYFIGYTSVLSCGPLYRFVIGTDAAAHQVAGAISKHLLQSGKRRR
jgi:cation diffusion facilitator CzcD-associated flavoprotein CzcO